MRPTLMAVLAAASISVAAQTTSPAPPLVLSSINEIWDVTGEAAQQPQRIQTEVLIYYFDADWSCVFGESRGRQTFIPVSDCPTPLKPGQRVAIDGLVIPASQRFLWDQTKIQVLAEDELPRAVDVSDLSLQASNVSTRVISIPALVERLDFPDPHHVRMDALSGTNPVTAFILTDTNTPLPFKEGDCVRLNGVYVPKFNDAGDLIESALWVARREDVQVTGALGAGPSFDRPVTAIDTILEGSLLENEMIRVAGTVRRHEPGKWVTLWDNTGQVTVHSAQTQPLQFGDRVEAVGFPYAAGVQAHLRDALYHLLEEAAPANPSGDSPTEPIRLAAQIQYLNSKDVARHPAVLLRAVLLWSHPDTPFMYVQDASGGIRVVNPDPQGANLVPGALVIVSGNVSQGEYMPVVTNAVVSRVGWHGFDSPQPVSLDQAMKGVDDGRWIELRGFVRNVTQAGGLTHMELATSGGEFQAWTPPSPAVDLLPNSIVRIAGVCSAVANDRRQLTGIQLWVPDQLCITVEQAGTTNLFTADLRQLGDLRRFGSKNELNERLKTVGTVVLHQPGRYLYLQDGRDTVFALSRQENLLQPGDRVEVVGLPGRDRGKFLLREAVFRRLGSGVCPAPLLLRSGSMVDPDLDGMLAKAEGVLLNVALKEDHVRLLIRNNGSLFEAGMEAVDPATARHFRDLPPGCRLALTGVYEVQNDEYSRPVSFLLQMRAWDDVRILARPPWWTLPRLLTLLAVVATVFALSIIWGIMISRKNRQLRRTRDELETVNKELEAFAYSVSHDLRAPLRHIDGYVGLLVSRCRDGLNVQGLHYLDTIAGTARRMGELIDDLLQFSRTGRAGMKRERVDMNQALREALDELKESCGKRSIEWVIGDLPSVQGDPALIRQVWANLLGNAIKYTWTREIARIEVGAREENGETVFFVADNGVGFDMQYVDKLFGVFQRLHSAEEFEGTGIGLATVHRIVTRHGGRIWAEAEVDQGAIFHFTLPTMPD